MSRNLILREKDRIVLKSTVEHYLKSGQPVSSGALVQKRVLPDSPATLRNIMAKLGEMGYLSQPHTSAGRIPTDKGLRFYVNSLFDETLFADQPSLLESAPLDLEKGDFASFLTRVTKLLAEQSDNLGFVISPRISKINFQHLRLIKVSEEKVMLILMTTFNLVLTEIVECHHYFTQLELDKASHYLNQHFRGKNLTGVRDYLLKELPRYKLTYENELNNLTALLRDYIAQEEIDRLKSLFQNLEEKVKLAKLISDFISLDRVKVLIGAESNIPDISDCALILSHYGYNNQVLGTLGIIGPKRIPYRKIIPLVDRVAQKLSLTISRNQ
jgi:heat-inducible transcriptional repressor